LPEIKRDGVLDARKYSLMGTLIISHLLQVFYQIWIYFSLKMLNSMNLYRPMLGRLIHLKQMACLADLV